jgi:hypothetical protein
MYAGGAGRVRVESVLFLFWDLVSIWSICSSCGGIGTDNDDDDDTDDNGND